MGIGKRISPVTRPDACEGCPLNPSHPKFDRAKVDPDGFVPPWNGSHSMVSPVDVGTPSALFIGMAPSEWETREGEPFVGPSFAEMNRAQSAVNGRLSNVAKTNIVNCRTWKRGKTSIMVNREPTAAEQKACTRRWLIPMLRALATLEATGHVVHLFTFGQLAFNAVFQRQRGTFSGHKGARGHRLNRKGQHVDALVPRLEAWTKGHEKKESQK